MKKIIIGAALILGFGAANNSYAQIPAKSLFIGGGVEVITTASGNNNSDIEFNVSPKVGYFLSEKMAIGGSIDIFFQSSGSGSTEFGVTPFSRLYFLSEPTFGVYGDAVLPIRLGDGYIKLAPGVGAGFTFFPTKRIALEGRLNLLRLDVYSADGNGSADFYLGVNLDSFSWSIIYFLKGKS